ncbi:MAG: DUF2175 family protein [Candidatus Lokiarchaeota archaeon]|nr:DUF2175 family protein [Candidatus Lokiarchaeota archaeon]
MDKSFKCYYCNKTLKGTYYVQTKKGLIHVWCRDEERKKTKDNEDNISLEDMEKAENDLIDADKWDGEEKILWNDREVIIRKKDGE